MSERKETTGASRKPSGSVMLRIRHDRLKGWLDAVRPLNAGGRGKAAVGERLLTFDRKGVHISAVDASHVAMQVMDLTPRAFEEYHVDGEPVICLDLEKVVETLKIGKKGDTLEFRAGGPLSIEGAHGVAKLKVGPVVRTMGLLDPSTSYPPKVPDVGNGASGSVVLDAGAMLSLIKSAEAISDHVVLSMKDGKRATLTAEGETDKVSNPLPIVGDATGDMASLYPLDFLGAMVRALGKADHLALQSGKEYPMKLSFRFEDDGAPWLEGFYLLAPRVVEDEPTPNPSAEPEVAMVEVPTEAVPEGPSGPEPDDDGEDDEPTHPEAPEPAKPDTDLPIFPSGPASLPVAPIGAAAANPHAWAAYFDGIHDAAAARDPVLLAEVRAFFAGPDAVDRTMVLASPAYATAAKIGLASSKLSSEVPVVRVAADDPTLRAVEKALAVVDAHATKKKPTALAVQVKAEVAEPHVELGTYRFRCEANGRLSRTTYTSVDSALKAAQVHDAECDFYSVVFGTNADGSKVTVRSDGKRVRSWPEVEDEQDVHPVSGA